MFPIKLDGYAGDCELLEFTDEKALVQVDLGFEFGYSWFNHDCIIADTMPFGAEVEFVQRY
jgi:hypothetical protein